MKRLALALAATALTLMVGGSAFAAKPEAGPKAPDPKNLAKGMADTPAIVQAAGLTCTVKSANYTGSLDFPINKKVVKHEGYEVACSEGRGYILAKPKEGEIVAIPCARAQYNYDEAVKAKKPTPVKCNLPDNVDTKAQLQTAFGPADSCKIKEWVYMGTNDKTKADRYEASCDQGGGYIYDIPMSGKSDKTPISCLQAESAGVECKLTNKAANLAAVTAMAATVDKSCQVGSTRWVGADATGHEYIEVGCSGSPGFFLKTIKGAAPEKIDCARAAGIGDGCKLTDVAVVKSGAAGSYASVLKAHGIACTPSDFKIIGTESRSNREVVELVCPEQKFGFVMLNPGAGATGKFESMDCISSAAVGINCTLTQKSSVLAGLKPILTAVDKVCDPTDFRVVGPGDTDGDLIEVKCTAPQTGYMIDVPANRAKTIKTLSCEQAARGYDKCAIPGNM